MPRWVYGTLFTDDYMEGVRQFMQFVKQKFSEDELIPCPCSTCLNLIELHQTIVKKHIIVNGMDSTYTKWIHHGEDSDIDVIEHPVDVHGDNDDSMQGTGLAEDGPTFFL